MAQRTGRQASKAEVQVQTRSLWWIAPSVVGGCIAGLVLAYLHVYYGKATMGQAAGIAAVSVIIFLISYLILRRIKPSSEDKPIRALITSIAVSIPFFVMAFIGLGFEIPQMANYTLMYILGTWVGSSEAALRTD